MRQAAPLAMHRDAIVAVVADGIGLIVTDREVALATQQVEQRPRQPRIAVVEHADLPGARHALEGRGEAVDGDQHGLLPGILPAVELGHDAVVIGPEDLASPGRGSGRRQAAIARDRRRLAHRDDRGRRLDRPVAVDRQPRIGLQDEERVEPVGQRPGQAFGADVPGDVPPELGGGQAEIAKAARQPPAGMIAGEKER